MPIDVDGSPTEQRIVEAASVVAGHPGAIGGWAAVAWRGARWFDGTERGEPAPVPVTISTFDRRPQSGLLLSGEPLPAAEVEVVDGVRCLCAVRAVADELRRARTLGDAVRIACMAAYDDLVAADELLAHAAACGPRTGVRQLREAARLMSENCWSPREADMLVEWGSLGDLPPVLVNQPVFDLHGRHLGTPDLLEPTAGLAVEYDGFVHLDPDRRRGDVRRDHLFREAGLEVVTVVAGMRREERAALFRAAHARACSRTAADRRWTAEPPRWWVSTTTVADRRRLAGYQRERLLRYRAA